MLRNHNSILTNYFSKKQYFFERENCKKQAKP